MSFLPFLWPNIHHDLVKYIGSDLEKQLVWAWGEPRRKLIDLALEVPNPVVSYATVSTLARWDCSGSRGTARWDPNQRLYILQVCCLCQIYGTGIMMIAWGNMVSGLGGSWSRDQWRQV
jgi:hypothetical protein